MKCFCVFLLTQTSAGPIIPGAISAVVPVSIMNDSDIDLDVYVADIDESYIAEEAVLLQLDNPYITKLIVCTSAYRILFGNVLDS